MSKVDEVSDILEMQLKGIDTKTVFEEVGTVLEVGDGVAHVFGLDNVRSSELVEFENGVRGVAMNLEQDNVGVILMNAGDRVKENFTVKRILLPSKSGKVYWDGSSTLWEILSTGRDRLRGIRLNFLWSGKHRGLFSVNR